MNIIFTFGMIFIMLLPYIILAVLISFILWIIKTKLIKSKVIKILIILIIVFSICITICNLKEEKPNELYLEMKEVDENQRLLGLSKEQVIVLLGEPTRKDNSEDENRYIYSAGNIAKGLFIFNKSIFVDSYINYELYVNFDESDKVVSTSIKYVP